MFTTESAPHQRPSSPSSATCGRSNRVCGGMRGDDGSFVRSHRHRDEDASSIATGTSPVDHAVPDLYQEDGSDVGPRVLATPVDESSVRDASLLEPVVLFNKGLLHHANDSTTDHAKRLYQVVVFTVQSYLRLGRTSSELLEVGMRVHNNLGQLNYQEGSNCNDEVTRAHFEAALMFARELYTSSNENGNCCYDLEYATVLSNWCRMHWMMGSMNESVYKGLCEVLQVRGSSLSWDHPDVAAAHYNVALAEYARQNGSKATWHFTQYLNIATQRSKRENGDNHQQHHDDHEDLDKIPALIYLLIIREEEKNNDDMSMELVRALRTLQDQRQEQGPESGEVASTLNLVGTLLFHKSELQNALMFFQEELRIEEQLSQSQQDISLSVTRNNIGRILQELGRFQEAIYFYQCALEAEYGDLARTQGWWKSSLVACAIAKQHEMAGSGPEPSSVKLYSTVWYNLGLIHDKLGSYGAALCAFQMSLELRKIMLGNDHPDIACLLYNIGVLQMEQEQLGEASASFRDALRIHHKGGPAEQGQLNDHHVVKTLQKLTSLHKAKGNIASALEAWGEVLRIQQVTAEYNHNEASRCKEMGITLRSIADLHHSIGNLQQSIRVAQESVDKLRRAAAHLYHSCGQQQQQQGQPSNNDKERLRVLEQLASSLLLVGSLYHEMSEPMRASTVFKQADAMIQQVISRSSGRAISPSLVALRDVTVMLALPHCAAMA